jgi:hypothetical protein
MSAASTTTANTTKYGVAFAGHTTKNTVCTGAFMASGHCYLEAMWNLPAANTADEPTIYAKDQVITAYCGKSDYKLGAANLSTPKLGVIATVTNDPATSTVDAAAVTAPT